MVVASVVVVAAVVDASVVDATVVVASVVVVTNVVGPIVGHMPLPIAHLCLLQHSHMVKERNDSCSSGVILARAAILVLTPEKQKVLPSKVRG